MQFPQSFYGPPVYADRPSPPYQHAPFQQSPFSSVRTFPTFSSVLSPTTPVRSSARFGVPLPLNRYPLSPTRLLAHSLPQSPISNERSISTYPDDEPVRIILQTPPPVPKLQPTRPDPWKDGGHPFSFDSEEVRAPMQRTETQLKVAQLGNKAETLAVNTPAVASGLDSSGSPSKYSTNSPSALLANHSIEYQEAPQPDQRHMMHIKDGSSNSQLQTSNLAYFLSVGLFVGAMIGLSLRVWLAFGFCGGFWLFMHPLFLYSLTRTDEWVYFSNIIDYDALHRHVNRITHDTPTVKIVVSNFHMGLHRARIRFYERKEITSTESYNFPTADQPHEWVDESDALSDLTSSSSIRVKFAPAAVHFAGGYKGGMTTGALAAFKTRLVQQHQLKDKQMEIIDSLQVGGTESKFLVIPATGGIFRPLLLNKVAYFIFAALFLLAPYRLYYKLVAPKLTFRVRKKLTVFPTRS